MTNENTLEHNSFILSEIYVIHQLGGPYWEKLCPRSRVRVLETEGTVFPNTDRPRPVNNIFIYF